MQKRNRDKKPVSFQGAESLANAAFSQIQTSKILECTFLDLGSMVIPRTVIDFTRSKDAGTETGCREFSGTIINDLSPGITAAGIGYMLGKVISPKIGGNTMLPVNSSTLEILNNAWTTTNPKKGLNYWSKGADKKQCVQNYFKHIFEKSEGLVGKEWVKFKDQPEQLNTITGKIADLVINKENLSKKQIKESLRNIEKTTVEIFGAAENIKILSGEKQLETTVKRLLNDAYRLSKEVFTEVKPNKVNPIINKLIKVSPVKSVLAVCTVVGLAFSQQFVNRYFTKKRTGKDGFVGISEEDSKKNKESDTGSKLKFKLAKAASVAGIISLAVSTITGTTNPKKILKAFTSGEVIKKLEFTSMFPHVNQLRAAYSAMIAGRMLAARDKHELRETDTRDFAGFLNWLVLGSFVSKGVGKLISKGEIINTSAQQKGKGFLSGVKHFLVNESLVSHAEINARKITVEKAKEILSDAGKNIVSADKEKIIDEAKNILKKQLNKSIFAGLAYSTLALGLFMPMLNKYITKRILAKNKTPEDSNTKTIPLNNQVIAVNNEVFSDFVKIKQGLKKA